jgi:Flp pilus assembly protein TadD
MYQQWSAKMGAAARARGREFVRVGAAAVLFLLAAGAAPSSYERARESFARGDISQTLTLTSEEIARNPGHAETHALRGVALEQVGRGEEALESYRTAVRLKPDYAEVYRNLALLHSQRQEYAEALEAGRKALEIEPRHADALNNLGVAALKLGRLEEAESALRRALELEPGSTHAHYNLGLIEAEQGRVGEAIEELEIAYQGAQKAQDQYRRQWIGEVCSRLLGRFPRDGSAWKVHRLLGRLYHDQGWYGSAIPHLQAAAGRRDFYSQLHLGVCYKQKSLAGEAISALRKAVSLRPDDYQARNELGHALGTLDDRWKEAESEFRTALERRPDSPEVRYNLAFALLRQERREEAIAEFEEAFRLKPDMAESEHFRSLGLPPRDGRDGATDGT